LVGPAGTKPSPGRVWQAEGAPGLSASIRILMAMSREGGEAAWLAPSFDNVKIN
jgi:hypothetical protein